MQRSPELVVALAWDGRRVRRVELRASGALDIAALLAGREPEDAARLLPQLYSVCAGAQRAAAEAALAGAAGTHADCSARARAVRLESVHEHLWRLLIDWPRACGSEPQFAVFAPARKALAAARGAGSEEAACALGVAAEVAEAAVFGTPPAHWARLAEPAALRAWAERGATQPAALLAALWREQPALGLSEVALMPAGRAVLRAALPGIFAARSPAWDGSAAETGALARLQAEPLIAALRTAEGNTAVVRLCARLLELARLLDEEDAEEAGAAPRVQCLGIAADEGVGAVHTARGLLLHRARLAAGRVCDYRIIAPTDWNFAPQGPLVAGLTGTEANDAAELEARARLAVLALDPCVACRVEIGHA